MKKFAIILGLALATVACSPTAEVVSVAPTTRSARLVNTATHSRSQAVQPLIAIYADLDVASTKITHLYIPSKTVAIGGYDNIINTAVREALAANGNADVLVAMELQVKYDPNGSVESVVVSGYPATYTNFRNASDEVLSGLVQAPVVVEQTDETSNNKPLGVFNFGNK